MGRGRDDAMAPVLLSAALLAGGIAAAVSVAAVRLAPPGTPPVASVRIAELTAAFAIGAAEEDGSAQAVRAWGAALERALALVAERRGVVLLPARAVAAGAPDVTGEVEAAMARLLGETPPETGADVR